MASDYKMTKIDKKYILVSGLSVIVSWTLHELAHWAMGEFLGYKMGMTLNNAYPLGGHYLKDLHYQIISAAGPIFTLFEAILVFILMMQRKRVLLYPLLFTCFYMRLVATLLSFRNLNDEARISSAIGIGKFTLPIIMIAFLFALIHKVAKAYRFDNKFNLVNLGLIILFSSLIIFADMYFKAQLF